LANTRGRPGADFQQAAIATEGTNQLRAER
jgi:hypothetical protein